MKKINILNLNIQELTEQVTNLGIQKFRGKQIFGWLHQKQVRSFSEMSNISKKHQDILEEHFYIPLLNLLKHQVSKKDKTEKFLFGLEDGESIESVLLIHKERNTLCVSSQVGCPVRCNFCATGIGGFTRNLNTNEILNQVYTVNRRLMKKGKGLTNIVFMGMGEPLLNTANVFKAIELISDDQGINISKRRITISTSGIIPGIEELLGKKYPVELAISLHAITDEKRSELIPVNKKYPLKDLFDTLHHYQSVSKRRITFEYILIDNFNDTKFDADLLADFAHNFDHLLNIIPYNKVEGFNHERPSKDKVYKFYNYLKNTRKVNATIRGEKGNDLDGACGQLKQKK